VNTPVVYNIFIRPQIAKQVFEVIRSLKPNILYIFSDGGRDDDEMNLVRINRFQIESMVDWDCNLRLEYQESNKGIDFMFNYAMSKVFEDYDRLIYLEEDMLPSETFFRFCDELLEKYKDETNVYLISGRNDHIEYPKSEIPSYIFVNTASIWGFAIWKRTYEMLINDLSKLTNEYYKNLIKYYFLNKWRNKSAYKLLNNLIDNPNGDYLIGEFYFMSLNQALLYNSLAIIPSKNQVQNIGATIDSEHTDLLKALPSRIQRTFTMPALPINFPLNHPEYRINDEHYYHLLSLKYPQPRGIFFLIERLDRIIRLLIYRGPIELLKKVRKKFKI
jgi:hypothetical protein